MATFIKSTFQLFLCCITMYIMYLMSAVEKVAKVEKMHKKVFPKF